MSKLMRLTLAILLIGLVSMLSACGKTEPEQAVVQEVEQAVSEVQGPAVAEETFELYGDYAIDISNLGMALTFYLRIAEDDTFVLSANRAFSDDRGSGTIGELDGTYLMIYADSTPDRSKTATFERVGPNLIFRSILPYGSANISFEKEDDDNPEIIYQLTGDKYVYEEYYDTYLGFGSVDGARYDYVLQLGAGAKYKLVVNYSLGEGLPVYEEMGSFRISGGGILITPAGGEELAGSILADGALELEVRPEDTLDRTKVLFRVATTAEHAGTWHGQGEAGTTARLDLDYFGGYDFTSTQQDESYAEAGAFAVTQGVITFTTEGQETPLSGTKAGYVLRASLNGFDWVLYDEAILGEFTGGTMVNEAYLATLQTDADGSYTLTIVDQDRDSTELVNEAGVFTILPGPMSYVLTLTHDETVRVGDIWPSGFNMTFDIDGTNYSFLLTK